MIVDLNVGKTRLASFDQPNNSGAVNVRMSEFVLEENHLFYYNAELSLLNWIGAVTFSLLLKLPPGKLEP